ncbi:hypothetical protein DV738_g1390, partial [Chaetothyriales sp. CBS 135597]
MAAPTTQWWKTGTAYQVWPMSYKDSNGDGIGDIPGVTSTLPYLKDLGIDFIWLSPMYDSPQKDFGYDIANYEAVYAPFGTLKDMDDLIAESHRLGMKIILDLVINHTSDQHAWFKESASSRTNDKADWYIWKDPKIDADGKRQPPNNWQSIFRGSAWEYVPARDQYYLHLFAVEQPDLNWENDDVRKAIQKTAIEFWLDRGVDGFRVDTANLYSKDTAYPDAEITFVGEKYQPAFKHFINGPRMHEWLQEQRTVIEKYGDIFLVGELPHTPADEVLKYVSAASGEYSCIFDFDVVNLGGQIGDGVKKHQMVQHTLPEFKETWRKTQHLIRGTDAWITVFLENHDQPRSLARFATDAPEYREKASKLLSILLSTLSGTLFVYQGQEIGMTNFPPPSGKPGDWTIDDIKDIDSLNSYHDVAQQHDYEPLWVKKAFKGLQKAARDNSRLPVQWDDSANAGFTTGKPWMRVNDDYKSVNVKAQLADPKSPLNFWKQTLKLRKEYSDLTIFGDFEIWDKNDPDVFTFTKRSLAESDAQKGRKLVVFCSFSNEEQPLYWPQGVKESEAKLLISNVDEPGKYLSPWEGAETTATPTPPRIGQDDYNLSTPITSHTGLRAGLTSYGDPHFSLFLRKVFIKALGYSDAALSLPIIGIINTYSSFNPCHSNVPQLIEALKRGVCTAGGLPVDFPTISIHESFSSPTSMYLRNLMSIDTEEMIKAQPVDAVIAIGGCDKTVPAQLMGAISANKPFLPLITGPMMPGSVGGVRVGACTDCRSSWAKYRAGQIDVEEIMDISGTCGVMGTASTMACVTAALGLIDPKAGATAAAVSSARLRVAEHTGRSAVALLQMMDKDKVGRPQELLTRESFLNAITVLQAIGGSTNAIVHLLAIINRHPDLAGSIDLATFDEIGRKTPLLVDLKPSGANYMTDFHNAGGMLALLHELRSLLHLNARLYTGQTLGEYLDATPFKRFDYSRQIIRPLSDPLWPASSLVVLFGNLCPQGAVIKQSASKDRRLLRRHRGRACVFENTRDLAERIDSDALPVTRDSVLVLKSIGPVGNPGMPEAGLIPIPRKLAVHEGVTDMLRISDGRMSGTAGGTVILHVSPESARLDSVLGIVQTGDEIVCDVEARRLTLDVPDDEIKRRIELRARSPEAAALKLRSRQRGYRGLYERNVNQAHLGCDFDVSEEKEAVNPCA